MHRRASKGPITFGFLMLRRTKLKSARSRCYKLFASPSWGFIPSPDYLLHQWWNSQRIKLINSECDRRIIRMIKWLQFLRLFFFIQAFNADARLRLTYYYSRDKMNGIHTWNGLKSNVVLHGCRATLKNFFEQKVFEKRCWKGQSLRSPSVARLAGIIVSVRFHYNSPLLLRFLFWSPVSPPPLFNAQE